MVMVQGVEVESVGIVDSVFLGSGFPKFGLEQPASGQPVKAAS
jgi:hypothetical protein